MRDVDPFQLAATSHRGTGKTQRGRGRTRKDGRGNIKKSTSHDIQPADSAIGSKDTSLFLFRALGKILYCKRGPATDPLEQPPLPRHLTHHYRDPLLVNPEEVIERSQLSGEFFTAFLHQNYPEFYMSVDDLVSASEYLSDADYLTTDWVNRSTLTQYGACVASRGIMFCNSARALSSGKGPSGLGWRPLHKPQWFTAIKQARNRSAAAKCLFRGHCWSHEDLLTQTLPYLCLINVPLHSPGQISFLQEIGKYSKSKYISRSDPEKLDEKDVALEDETEEVTTVVSHQNIGTSHAAVDVDTDLGPSSSQGQMKDSAAVEEENGDDEVIIEDFDD
ncbi:hypothetical protein NP493_109g05003 [Ridgeia piscesae]|uniref:Uncharacterized protein n=1 Tax=Ridgeia piscesae TaxID=27915 RepID=A0AAD9UH47_RIDPI|nr:hypothetical protein NP493_109g05003 [Ridgeia piscesae]